jgi:hypothetical protein
MNKLLLRCSLCLTLALVSVSVYAAEGSFDRTLHVTGPVNLEVITGDGNITVRQGSSSAVEVHARIRAKNGWGMGGNAAEKIQRLESNPPIRQQGNMIQIGKIDDPDLRHNISISYEVVTPHETELKTDTGAGNIEVSSLQGPVHAGSGSGNVTVRDIQEDVRASSGSGEVSLQGIKGRAHGSTGSGSIHAESIEGSYSLTTGSGNIRLTQIGAGDGRVSTGSGNLTLSGVKGGVHGSSGSGSIAVDGQPSRDWSLHTGSGNIRLSVPSSAAFDLDAHTDSGTVRSSHDVVVHGTLRRGDLKGKVGQGGAIVELRTGSGDIQID